MSEQAPVTLDPGDVLAKLQSRTRLQAAKRASDEHELLVEIAHLQAYVSQLEHENTDLKGQLAGQGTPDPWDTDTPKKEQ